MASRITPAGERQEGWNAYADTLRMDPNENVVSLTLRGHRKPRLS